MSESAGDTAAPDSLSTILAFRGAIGKGRYFIGLLVTVILILATCALFAAAMNPTGGGAPLLGFPLLLIALYVHLAVTAARLRDAGRSPWLSLLFVFGALAWLGIGVELTSGNDSLWILVIIILLGIYAVPGLMKRKRIEKKQAAAA